MDIIPTNLQTHDERCRVRIEDLIKENEPERYEKALERVCRTEMGEDRGVKRRAVFADDPTAPATTVAVQTRTKGPAPVQNVAW